MNIKSSGMPRLATIANEDKLGNMHDSSSVKSARMLEPFPSMAIEGSEGFSLLIENWIDNLTEKGEVRGLK